MPLREVPERFKVAFSLAGEQRELVHPVALEVERILDEQTVFYYEWYEHWTAGQDSDLLLQRLYGEMADVVVVCVCRAYGDKPWTQTECRAVRARLMRSTDRLRMFPLRVGEGDVPGIELTDIVPDIRGKTPVEAAELIVARLNLVRGSVPGSRSRRPAWPSRPPELHWPMADHSEARTAYSELLSESSPVRILLVRGASETGKSHMSKQMAKNCQALPGISFGRFDFKGTADIADEVESFCTTLGIPPPSHGSLRENFREILAHIRESARPTVLIFDTYEMAAETGKWIENVLLPSLMTAPMIRVVIVGQEVPTRANAIWEEISTKPLSLQMPGPEHWYEYGRANKPDLVGELSAVMTVHQLAQGRPTILQGLYGPRA